MAQETVGAATAVTRRGERKKEGERERASEGEKKKQKKKHGELPRTGAQLDCDL